MEDTEFDATLKKLSDQVSQFTSTTINKPTSSGGGFLSNISIKSPLVYYGVIPIAVMIILFFWKPGFVMEEVSVEGSLPEKKLSFKKLIVGSVIITTVIAVIIFISYYHKVNK
jgi:hypothetical protein